MKAILTTEYGRPLDVLQLRQVANPEPSEAEVLVRLFASSVNPLDDFSIRGPLFFVPKLGRLLKPTHRIAGADYAGIIESTGPGVNQFRPGDAVFGASFTGKGQGGFAEYVCAREDALAPKPTNLSFEQAAAVPVAAITALQALRDHGGVQPGQNVLIDGASGGVGTFAIQIAKSFGANVTAVCSTRNLELARSLGANHVIDYTRVNFTRNGLRYDLIVGVNAHHSIFDYRRALSQNGTFVLVGGDLARMLQAISLKPLLSMIGSKKMRFFYCKGQPNGSDGSQRSARSWKGRAYHRQAIPARRGGRGHPLSRRRTCTGQGRYLHLSPGVSGQSLRYRETDGAVKWTQLLTW